MDFAGLMKQFGGAAAGNQQAAGATPPPKTSILGNDSLNNQQKMSQSMEVATQGGSLINTNAKDAGGYTDASSSAMDGAMKGLKIGGPWGAAVGAAVGLVKGFQNRRTEHRNNQTMLGNAGRQQAADSYHAFDKVIGGLR